MEGAVGMGMNEPSRHFCERERSAARGARSSYVMWIHWPAYSVSMVVSGFSSIDCTMFSAAV